MMKNRLAVGGTLVALAALAACSPDTSVSPVAKVRPPVMTGPGFALLVQPSAGLPSTMTVCSDDASASFSVSVFSNALGAAQVPPLVGAGPYTLAVAANACQTIWIKAAFTSLPTDPTTSVTVTQTGVQAGWQFSNVEASGNTGTGVNVGAQQATLAANGFHGATATFTQTLIPTICTYTKGWYQNPNGKPTVIAVDGRTIGQAQQIFEASPGQPGNVTWGVGVLTDNKPNNLLNLYQQFLAALQNLGGDANEDNGPAAVDAAIDAVQAATSGAGTNISILAGSVGNISGWINTLSAFNQGEFAGFPHCSDEVLN